MKHNVQQAIQELKKTAKARFDESVEVHINLNIDVKKDQIRTNVDLPHGTGKTTRLVIIANDYPNDLPKKHPNVKFGGEELIEKIESGNLKTTDFDVLLATPSIMPKLAKIAKVLGPKGLMPNPKSGTVAEDIELAIQKFSKGKAELRTEPNAPVIHMAFGKKSFEDNKLAENFNAVHSALLANKPPKAKPDWIKSIYVSTTMGKSFKVEMG